MARRRRWRPKSHPLTLASVLDGAYPGKNGDRPLLRTFSWWDATVPQRIAQRARPVKLSHGTLVIHTVSSAWAQELTFHMHDLLKSVQKRVPKVARLRIRVGPMPPPPPPPEPMPPKTIPLPVEELPGEVARGLAQIGDDRLRSTLTKAACTSLAPIPPAPPTKRR